MNVILLVADVVAAWLSSMVVASVMEAMVVLAGMPVPVTSIPRTSCEESATVSVVELSTVVQDWVSVALSDFSVKSFSQKNLGVALVT